MPRHQQQLAARTFLLLLLRSPTTIASARKELPLAALCSSSSISACENLNSKLEQQTGGRLSEPLNSS